MNEVDRHGTTLSAAYRRILIQFVRRRVHDSAEAEDIAQEALLRAVRSASTHPSHNPEALLFSITTNLLKDRARRQRTRQAMLENASRIGEFVEDLSPERVLLAKETLGAVLQALDRLDDRARDAFILHRLDGMTHAEIAARFCVSVSSVEKYIMRALAVIAKYKQEHRGV